MSQLQKQSWSMASSFGFNCVGQIIGPPQSLQLFASSLIMPPNCMRSSRWRIWECCKVPTLFLSRWSKSVRLTCMTNTTTFQVTSRPALVKSLSPQEQREVRDSIDLRYDIVGNLFTGFTPDHKKSPRRSFETMSVSAEVMDSTS